MAFCGKKYSFGRRNKSISADWKQQRSKKFYGSWAQNKCNCSTGNAEIEAICDLRGWFTNLKIKISHVLAKWKKRLSEYNCVPRSHAETLSAALPKGCARIKRYSVLPLPSALKCALLMVYDWSRKKRSRHSFRRNVFIHFYTLLYFMIKYDQFWKILGTCLFKCV